MNCAICNTQMSHHALCRSTVAGYRSKSVEESIAQPLFDLELMLCPNCQLLSQKPQAEAERLLEKLYEEHASTQHSTAGPSQYFLQFTNNAIEKYRLTQKSRILEIGCNCATLLELFRNQSGAKVIGVEPSKALADSWHQKEIDVINAYFDAAAAQQLSSQGQFDLVYFRHVLEHVPQPSEFMKNVASVLDDEGVVLIEVPYLETIFSKKRIENVSYSHIHHYCIRSLDALLKPNGLGIFDFSLENTDGGAIVVHAKKGVVTNSQWLEQDLQQKLALFLTYNLEMKAIAQQKISSYAPGTVVGYGAGAKGQHLIHALGLADILAAVIDDTPGFSGMFVPGTRLKIESRSYIRDKHIAAVVNLAPTHSSAIKANVPADVEFIDFINS